MVHRRVPVIAKRQIVDLDGAAHSSAPMASQISAMATKAPASRGKQARLGQRKGRTLRHGGGM